jgi:broad specificity phosphatase PhoE
MSDQELINGGLNIDQFYRSQVKNLRSIENEYQYYDRSKETMKKIIKLHRKTSGTILIVAHAPSLEVLTRHLMNGQPRPEHLVDLSGKVNYCSMTIVDGNPSSNIWQFRYTLDDELTWQQLNNNITRSATLAYQPSAIPVDYRMATPRTSQLRYFV